MSAPPPPAENILRKCLGFCLVISQGEAGREATPTVKHFQETPLSLEQLVEIVRSLLPADHPPPSMWSFSGRESGRKTAIHNDADLRRFFASVETRAAEPRASEVFPVGSVIPSIEVSLFPRASSREPKAGASPRASQGAENRKASVEEENARLKKDWDSCFKRIEHLENSRVSDLDNFQSLFSKMWAEFQSLHLEFTKEVGERLKELGASQLAQESMQTEMRNRVESLLSGIEDKLLKVGQDVDALKSDVDRDVTDIRNDIADLEQADDRQISEGRRIEAALEEAKGDVEQLRASRLTRAEFQEYASDLDSSVRRLESKQGEKQANFQEVFKEEIQTLKANLEKTDVSLVSQGQQIFEKIRGVEEALKSDDQDNFQELSKKLDSLKKEVEAATSQAKEGKASLQQELQKTLDGKMEKLYSDIGRVSSRQNDLAKRFSDSFSTLDSNVKDLHLHLTSESEKLFKERDQHLKSVEKSVFLETSSLQQAIKDSTDVILKHLAQERTTAEEEVQRLEEKLEDHELKILQGAERASSLHSEIGSKAAELSEQVARQVLFIEEHCQKMANMLKTNKLEFETFKNATSSNLSVLQGDGSQLAEATRVLEKERAMLRSEVEVIKRDHKDFVAELDEWVTVSEVRLGHLTRSMQPTKVEWRIEGAMKKVKDHPPTTFIRSAEFSLQSIKGLRLDWYPSGVDPSARDSCCVLIYGPQDTHVRLVCAIGGLKSKPKLWNAAGTQGGLAGDLYTQFFFENWKTHVTSSGEIVISIEFLRNFTMEKKAEDEGGKGAPLLSKTVHLHTE